MRALYLPVQALPGPGICPRIFHCFGSHSRPLASQLSPSSYPGSRHFHLRLDPRDLALHLHGPRCRFCQLPQPERAARSGLHPRCQCHCRCWPTRCERRVYTLHGLHWRPHAAPTWVVFPYSSPFCAYDVHLAANLVERAIPPAPTAAPGPGRSLLLRGRGGCLWPAGASPTERRRRRRGALPPPLRTAQNLTDPMGLLLRLLLLSPTPTPLLLAVRLAALATGLTPTAAAAGVPGA
mmetsp:Transcript_63454/g.133760  ORF Transcript_63454/g.133760 Transcript_63454/m.133760 type:complete len:237 (+) Transcript_63454:1019-1729(+)